jgi:DNA-binding MarR family transcriptional regulator
MEPNQVVIDKVREFNRFYTNVIGLLNRHFLDTPFSLTEGRVLYEIMHTEFCTAKKICSNIEIDEGYLSRIIDKFIQKGLVRKAPAAEDRRLHLIVPSEKGKREFSKLNENSNHLIFQLLENLAESDRTELVELMDRIQALLSQSTQESK